MAITLQNFINVSKNRFPADFYILTVWGHGDGWFDDSISGDNSLKKAIAVDLKSGTYIPGAELKLGPETISISGGV